MGQSIHSLLSSSRQRARQSVWETDRQLRRLVGRELMGHRILYASGGSCAAFATICAMIETTRGANGRLSNRQVAMHGIVLALATASRCAAQQHYWTATNYPRGWTTDRGCCSAFKRARCRVRHAKQHNQDKPNCHKGCQSRTLHQVAWIDHGSRESPTQSSAVSGPRLLN